MLTNDQTKTIKKQIAFKHYTLISAERSRSDNLKRERTLLESSNITFYGKSCVNRTFAFHWFQWMLHTDTLSKAYDLYEPCNTAESIEVKATFPAEGTRQGWRQRNTHDGSRIWATERQRRQFASFHWRRPKTPDTVTRGVRDALKRWDEAFCLLIWYKPPPKECKPNGQFK